MEFEKNQAKTQTTKSESASISDPSCYKVKYDEKAGFMANLRNHYTVFVNTPMAEHKACFINSYVKMIQSMDWDIMDPSVFGGKRIFNFQKKD